ncbi:MAG: hypothetical protein ACSLFB_03880 [Acidimicrobiales bacterium]
MTIVAASSREYIRAKDPIDAARSGEQVEMPAELQAAMAESSDWMQNTEFLDLTDPLLF